MKAAIYARYSTDKQSKESADDQFRVCEAIAARESLQVVNRYADRAISGGTSRRPDYQSMLEAARRREFQYIIAEDSSRLWRNMAEQAPRLAELADLGVHVVTHDLDTRSESSGMLGAVLGKPGGRPEMEHRVDQAQAEVVRRIFTLYADGLAPRRIASLLNAERIPSPGATWDRTDTGQNGKRRDRKWVSSAVHGEPARGTGILNNARYTGHIIWGRTRWQRGAADSSVRLSRPATQPTIEYTDERLRIVSDDLWKRVKLRQRQITKASARVRHALRSHGGRPARHLLSGLLKCETCDSNFVRTDARVYGCSTHVNGGASACANAFRLNAKDAEGLLINEIETQLLSEEAVDAAVAAYKDEVKRSRRERRNEKPIGGVTTAIARKDKELEHLRRLAKSGEMDPATLQPAIDAAEHARQQLLDRDAARDDSNSASIARLMPDAARTYRAMVQQLRVARDVLTDAEFTETRALVFDALGGRVPVKPRADGSAILTLNLDAGPIFLPCKSKAYNVVAGGRRVNYIEVDL